MCIFKGGNGYNVAIDHTSFRRNNKPVSFSYSDSRFWDTVDVRNVSLTSSQVPEDASNDPPVTKPEQTGVICQDCVLLTFRY